MNSFDYYLNGGPGQAPASTQNIGYQGVGAMPMQGGMSINNPMGGMNNSMPQPPSPYAEKDMSGFANYGMTAPPLPDPTQQIGGLMKLAIGSNVADRQAQGQQAPIGGLMAYLRTLAGV